MGKSTKRGGGRRSPFIKSAVEDLIEKEPQWFIKKSADQVKEKITTEYGAVGAKTTTVNVVLIRLFNKRKLTRDEIEGKFVYSIPSIAH